MAVSRVLFLLLIIHSVLAQNCTRPELPSDGNISSDREVYMHADGVRVSCSSDQSLVEGDSYRQCMNGSWSGKAPLCIDKCSGVSLSDGSCVLVVKDSLNYPQSKDACKKRGGNLLEINELNIQSQLTNLLSQSNKSITWIGAHAGKAWQWLDGRTIEHYNWGPGEPSDLATSETKLQMMMKLDYKWNDASGNENASDINRGGTVNKFVCEYNVSCSNQPHRSSPMHEWMNGNSSSCFVFQGKHEHDLYDSRCVQWNEVNINHKDPNYWKEYCYKRGISWAEAALKCKISNATLAILDTNEKITTLTRFIQDKAARDKKFAGNYWLGGSFAPNEGSWKWVWDSQGEFKPLNMSNFNSTKFIPSGSSCVLFMNTGEFQSDNCFSSRHASLCQYRAEVKCGTPALPQHVKTDFLRNKWSYKKGETLKFECKPGYQLKESSKPFCECMSSGRWNPECPQSISCEKMVN